MSSELPEQLLPEFLDEFYAECDELLAAMGTYLSALELRPESIQRDRHLQDLFRALHTFKGNCGIVGLGSAEQASHAMEAVTRAAVREEVALSPQILESMRAATERLREFLLAHRHKSPLPNLCDLEAEWKSLLSHGRKLEADSATEEAMARPAGVPIRETPIGGGAQVWTCFFTPSPALEEQGVGIDRVRHRLGDMGKVLSCVPVVEPSKGLYFRLTIELHHSPDDVEQWTALGVRFEAPGGELGIGPVPQPGESKRGVVAQESDLTPSRLVRVDLGHLDDLMRITGEILIQRFKLKDRLGDRFSDDDDLKQLDHSLGRSLRDLTSTLYRVRLVPIAEAFSRIPYVVRELIRGTENEIRLRMEGEDTEVDKYLVERLREPLLHLVRNAVAHAFDPPDVRAKAGKPPQGTIVLRARRTGDAVEICVSDDGKGIDSEQVAERAEKLGLPVPPAIGGIPLLRTLCQSGFSTKDNPDHTAGRGEGMAIVARTVADLGGTLRLHTTVGLGTEFTLRLPLRLSIVEALIVRVDSQLCAVHQTHVDHVLQVSRASVRTLGGSDFAPYREGLLPLIRLRSLLRLAPSMDAELTVLVIISEGGAYGLVVDSVRGQKEVVVSSFCDPLIRVPGVAGATELGDGRPVLVIAPETMLITPNPYMARPASNPDSDEPKEITS